MKKKLSMIFCIISCMLMMAGCSLTKTNENFDKSKLSSQADKFIESWFKADFESTIETYKEQMDDNTIAVYKDYLKTQKRYKSVDKKLKTEYTISSDSATVTETVLCGNGEKAVITVTFGEDGNIQMDDSGNYVFKVDEYKTLAQKMGKAGINTVMSMGIVFFVLIFIALCILQFKHISKLQNLGKKEEAAPVEASVSAAQAVVEEEENLVDDFELVAVITAAIAAASENESADGLVIRSIIRRQ